MATAKKRVSDVDFVNVYVRAESICDVASALGLTESAVRVRAAKLRSLGVKLLLLNKWIKPTIQCPGLTE